LRTIVKRKLYCGAHSSPPPLAKGGIFGMTADGPERPVIVSAQARTQWALQKLARAFIVFAQQSQVAENTPATDAADAANTEAQP
jgi:hypothetical protein